MTVDEQADFPLDTSPNAAPLGSCLCISTQANGKCSLRAAVQASNACADAVDIITLDSTAATYRLDLPGLDNDAAAGDLDVVRHPQFGATGNKTVIIDLNNELVEEFIPGFDERIFDVPASETGLTLRISSGTLLNGTAPDAEQGGCLRALAGKIELTGVTFDNCDAYFNGGGIYAEDADLDIDSCVFDDNDLLNPLVVPGSYDPKGGAVSAHNSPIQVLASTFTRNTAQTGGAIHVSADIVGGAYVGWLEMDGSTVDDNDGRGRGGGLALFAPFSISDSKITNNLSTDVDAAGAGVYAEVQDEEGTITDSFIEHNTSVFRGGGIHVQDNTTLSVHRTSLSHNYDVDLGGGASFDGATAYFFDSGFANNQADRGGAMYIAGGAAVRLTNVSTSDNIALDEGGAVYNAAGDLTALHCSFFNDISEGLAGSVAGIYAADGTDTYLNRSFLMADIGTAYEHCTGEIGSEFAMGDNSACFIPQFLGDDTGMGVSCVNPSAPDCLPVVTVMAPSAALDNASPCGLAADARGIARNQDQCDIGAYEAP